MSNKFFGSLGHWSHIYGWATGDFVGAFTGASTAHINRGLYDYLTPAVPVTIQNSQVYNVSAQQNQARIGAPMPVLYGKFRIYPDVLTQPWSEYIDNEEYLYQLMCVTQGQAEMLTLMIGDTPIDSFAQVTYQLYQPGETVDMFHNNVFSNLQVSDLTLTTIGTGTAAASLVYNAAGHTITAATGIFTEDLFNVGDLIEVSGSLYNDGQYTIGFISGDFKQIVVNGTLVDEDEPGYYVQSTLTDTTASLTFGPDKFNYTAATKKIASPGLSVDLSTITVGDSITISGSDLNDGTYTVATVVPYSFSEPSYITVDETIVDEAAYHPPNLSRIILLSKDVGPFYANRVDLPIEKFSVDIVFPKGFYNSNDSGALTNSSATLNVEWRKLGDPTFTLAATETFTAAKNEAQRYTKTYTLPSGTTGLIEVKVTRTSVTANSNREVNESHWTGLRGFIIPPSTLPANYDGPTIISNEHYQYPDRTVLAVKVRATGQLSTAMSKQFNGVFQRLIPTWDGSAWTAPVATSSIAWIFADVINNSQYGIGRPTSEINTAELAALDATWTSRGDQFNGYFDQQDTIFAALEQIAKVGRAQPIFDGRTFSMIRDEEKTLRTALFTDQNVVKDSVSINFDFIGEETPQGVLVTYWDSVTYVQKTILCGVDINTTNLTLPGCTSRQQAWNEGNYALNINQYRRVNLTFGTEMDGFIPRNGDLVTVQTQWVNWGQSARVLAQDGLHLTLDQYLDWTGSGFVCELRNVDGTPSASITCSRGSDDNVLVLSALPDFDIQTDGSQERTHITLGNSGTNPVDVIVSQVSAADEFHASIQAVMDDTRVYADPGTAPPENP